MYPARQVGVTLAALQVLELPPGAELLASSPKTPIEMYRVGENTLGIQGHPEFNKDVVNLILRFSLDNGRMTVHGKLIALVGILQAVLRTHGLVCLRGCLLEPLVTLAVSGLLCVGVTLAACALIFFACSRKLLKILGRRSETTSHTMTF